MCGRYALFTTLHTLKDLLNVEGSINFDAKYNCAPMQQLPAIVHHKIGLARWGFVPHWAKEDNPQMASKMINARSETLAEKPAFRDAWKARHRCLIPADGFYEWKKENADTKPQPYYISRKNGCDTPLFFAGLWSKIGKTVTFTIITKQADNPISQLHHRMPVMIDPEDTNSWFKGTEYEARKYIDKASAKDLAFHPVSKDVGSVKNDHEKLILPLAA